MQILDNAHIYSALLKMMSGGGFAVYYNVAVTVRLIDVVVDPKLILTMGTERH
jgi:hypothetical protein